MKLKDFKVGQKVYIRLIGNACRGKHGEELIEEWEVVVVGRKYLTAKNGSREYQFKSPIIHENYFVQKTNHCINYILYASREDIEVELEKSRLFREVSEYFRGYGCEKKFTLEQLRQIKGIIENEVTQNET